MRVQTNVNSAAFGSAAVFLGPLVALLLASPGQAAIISDTQHMIDYGTAPLPAQLNFALFDFGGQPVLDRVKTLQINLAIEDGDTATGDYDFNNLSLGLDGIDTGIKLNGFPSGTLPGGIPTSPTAAPFYFTGTVSDAVGQQILDALADGQLVASIIDATPGIDDKHPTNPHNYVNLYSVFTSTLQICGCPSDPVPEPATLALWGLGLACGYAGHRRYRKQAAAGTVKTPLAS